MNDDIKLLAGLYKSNTEEAIEWIRDHPNDKSADITSKVKKIYYGYGGRGAGSSEYDIKIESDGIYIRNGEGADTNKYTYSAIVRELKEYMKSTDITKTYLDIFKEHYSNADVDTVIGEYCPDELFVGAKGGRYDDCTRTKCEECWNSVAIGEFNDNDVNIPDKWRVQPSEQVSEEPELSDEEFRQTKAELEEAFSSVDEKKIACPHWHKGETLNNKGFGAVEFECTMHKESFFEGKKLTTFLATHCYSHIWCPYCDHPEAKQNFPCDNCEYDHKGCCNYPEAPDDFCVMGDKQVPVTTEDNSAPQTPVDVPDDRVEDISNTFNYAVLSAELGEYLRHKEEQLKNEYMNFTANWGRIFAEAQEKLANNKNGLFDKWISSMGFKRNTVYRMIQVHKFMSSQIATISEKEIFDALPKMLQYDISAPSAPPELVEQVMSGDITTHKEYIELKKKLERTEGDLRNVERNFDEREKLRYELGEENVQLKIKAKKLEEEFERVKEELENSKDEIEGAEERAQYAESRLKSKSETVSKLSEMNATLEKRVKELEKRPLDVATVDNTEELAAKDAEISKLQQRIKENTEDVDMIRNTFMELCMYARTAFKACARFITNNNYSETTIVKLRCDAEGTIDTMLDIINDIRGTENEEDI